MSAVPAIVPATPSFRLDGRRALVTGSGRGLGFAAACALAQAGAQVTLCARSKDELDQGCAAIRGAGGVADALVLDVLDVASVRTAIAAAAPYDILVNNAGTNRPKPFIEVTTDDFDAVVNLNLRSVYFVSQAVAARLIEAGRGGTIINMSSQMGHVGGPTRTVYCATKHAMEGFTKAMAIELAPHKVRVNTLAPTFIETPMTRPFFQNEAFRKDTLNRIKLGRLGQLEDLTGAIVFLAGDASALMTGTSLVIDGGWTAE
jgi:NAD(P)-dependent dehydrogenase (short-subunit alcohol dehydrogenase family)